MFDAAIAANHINGHPALPGCTDIAVEEVLLVDTITGVISKEMVPACQYTKPVPSSSTLWSTSYSGDLETRAVCPNPVVGGSGDDVMFYGSKWEYGTVEGKPAWINFGEAVLCKKAVPDWEITTCNNISGGSPLVFKPYRGDDTAGMPETITYCGDGNPVLYESIGVGLMQYIKKTSLREVEFTLYGCDGVDTLLGSINYDDIVGGSDGDWIYGHEGIDDNICGDWEMDMAGPCSNNGTLYCDVIDTGYGDDNIWGDYYSWPNPHSYDYIYGGGGDDRICDDFDCSGPLNVGTQGFLYGGLGCDTISGAGGADVIYASNAGSPYDDCTTWNYIDGGSEDDTIEGSNAVDHIYGSLDSDTIYGRDDDDIIYGGKGDDTIEGGWGSDEIFGEDGQDIIKGDQNTCTGTTCDVGTCSDKICGGPDSDTISGGPHDDCIDGGGTYTEDQLMGNAGTCNVLKNGQSCKCGMDGGPPDGVPYSYNCWSEELCIVGTCSACTGWSCP
jgi:Ca2+-binding RTX toxin-like protein